MTKDKERDEGFTPGPWHTSRSEVFVYADENDDKPLAEIYPLTTWGRSRADARLIAAAPDLLAALVGMLSIAPDKVILQSTWDERLAAARAAIRKAGIQPIPERGSR